MQLVFSQHMTNILAKKTFDAFTELLHAVDIFLCHPPCSIGCIGRAGFELLNFFLDFEIPGNVCHQVPDMRIVFDDKHAAA